MIRAAMYKVFWIFWCAVQWFELRNCLKDIHTYIKVFEIPRDLPSHSKKLWFNRQNHLVLLDFKPRLLGQLKLWFLTPLIWSHKEYYWRFTSHSLIRGILIQSCSAGAKNFTNYVFCHPQFSGVIQNIENRCAILTPVCLCRLLSK